MLVCVGIDRELIFEEFNEVLNLIVCGKDGIFIDVLKCCKEDIIIKLYEFFF